MNSARVSKVANRVLAFMVLNTSRRLCHLWHEVAVKFRAVLRRRPPASLAWPLALPAFVGGSRIGHSAAQVPWFLSVGRKRRRQCFATQSNNTADGSQVELPELKGEGK